MRETEQIDKSLRAAKVAAATLTDTERTLRAQHAELTKERKGIAAATRSLDEVLANMRRLVDEAAVKWADRVAYTLIHSVSGYTELRDSGSTAERTVHPHLPRNRFGYDYDTIGLEDLCALAPEPMKAQLEHVIRNSGQTFGLPSDERIARLAELDAQIAHIAQQHTELIDGAAEVGIVLPLLDDVRERRETEAREAARARELAAERAAGIFRVGR